MAGTTPRYEAYCTHCHAGVLSRDSLVMMKGERLCVRCCQSHERMEARIRKISGLLLVLCTAVGGGIGFHVARYIGIFPGIMVGLIAASFVEGRLRHY